MTRAPSQAAAEHDIHVSRNLEVVHDAVTAIEVLPDRGDEIDFLFRMRWMSAAGPPVRRCRSVGAVDIWYMGMKERQDDKSQFMPAYRPLR